MGAYSAATTQTLFYRWIQPARDASDAAICVGTCALYRRTALAEAGGFAQIAHSEDVHTGLAVVEAGYRVRYVPTVVSKGLCPDDVRAFVTQQYRWCTGSMSLLLSRRFHRMQLTFRQRLAFWSGFLYYVSTAVSVFVLPLPPVILGLVDPSAVRVRNYVLVGAALLLRLATVPLITLRRDGLVGLARIQATYSYAHAVALADAFRGRTDAWVATGAAGSSPTASRGLRLARTSTVVTQLPLWGIVLWRAPEYGLVPYLPLAALALLNLLVVLPVLLPSLGGASRRPLASALSRRPRTA